MPLNFAWDRPKASANLRKHGLSFEEVAAVFADECALTIPDPDHSLVEARFILLGTSYRAKMLVVVHTERGDSILIISARPANRRERQQYEEAN